MNKKTDKLVKEFDNIDRITRAERRLSGHCELCGNRGWPMGPKSLAMMCPLVDREIIELPYDYYAVCQCYAA